MQSHTYFDRIHQRTVYRVFPGQFMACSATEGKLIKTVLGSCVAVCLTDTKQRTAGLNHFMLPGVQISESSSNQLFNQVACYGANAMELLINQMMQLGSHRKDLSAWVFGGANVLNEINEIGLSNAEFALNYLSKEGIPIAARDVGGRKTRKIYLDPEIGMPACFALEKTDKKVVPLEMEYQASLAKAVSKSQSNRFSRVSLFDEVNA